MAILDLEALLEPLSDEEPTGPNLEYDADFTSLEAAARSKPEQQYGNTIIPAEDPDWVEVRRLAIDLITRTKDLRIACLLARALLITGGFPSFCEGLSLVRGYLERYWTSVHPQLDPDDDNDPTLRVNTISSLSDPPTTVTSLRTAPMVSSRLLGQFSLRDLQIAMGETPPPPDGEAPKLSSIEAAFLECDLDHLRADALAIRDSVAHVDAIESSLTLEVGAARAVSLDSLRHTLRELQTVLDKNLAARDVEAGEDVAMEQTVTVGDGAATRAGRLSGEICSREDVVIALDKICQYYTRYEPSSPIPLLLGRAKRLASKNFLEIVKDLTPDALAQIQALGGVSEDSLEE